MVLDDIATLFILHTCVVHKLQLSIISFQMLVNIMSVTNTAPGQKILEAPHNLIYLPVTVYVISTLSV